MRVDNCSQLDQPSQGKLGWTNGHRGTDRGVCHPRGKLSRHTRPDLDVENLTTTTAMPSVEANPFTMKRMPGILYYDQLRSVCRMT
jgi:hypothetical protein